MIQQLPDGRGSVFAPEGDGCLQRAKREDAGRFSKEGKSLDDFWYFSSLKSTIKEKLHYDSSLSEFFSLVRKERKGQKEECFPLLISFCRLAATGANKVP